MNNYFGTTASESSIRKAFGLPQDGSNDLILDKYTTANICWALEKLNHPSIPDSIKNNAFSYKFFELPDEEFIKILTQQDGQSVSPIKELSPDIFISGKTLNNTIKTHGYIDSDDTLYIDIIDYLEGFGFDVLKDVVILKK